MFRKSGEHLLEYEGGRHYYTFEPKPLCGEKILTIDDELNMQLIQAHRSLGVLEGMLRVFPDLEKFETILQKYEAILSCEISGIDIPIYDILDTSKENDHAIQRINSYVKALQFVASNKNGFDLSRISLCKIHKVLMDNEPCEDAGEFRRKQIFIGKLIFHNGAVPVYHPPNPKNVQIELLDFEKYINLDCGYDVLIQAALLHYQFETIKPFMEGNGRFVRLFVNLFLTKRKLITKPLLCYSDYLLAYKVECADRISSVWHNGDYEQWVKFFLRAIIYAADKTINNLTSLFVARRADCDTIDLVKASTKYLPQTYDYILMNPVFEIKQVSEGLGISYNTAAKAVKFLVELGILKPIDQQKRYRRFMYAGYVEIFDCRNEDCWL